jgi:hypothetical protein
MKSVRNYRDVRCYPMASRIHKEFTGETPAEPYPRPAAPIRVAIGRKNAEILFAGSAAGTGGVLQINLGLAKGIAGSRGGILMTAGDATGRKAIVSRRSMSAPIISIREGTCRSAQKRIDAFLEDRLPPHATRWFVRHLLRCLNGRQELKSRDRAKGQMKCETFSDDIFGPYGLHQFALADPAAADLPPRPRAGLGTLLEEISINNKVRSSS